MRLRRGLQIALISSLFWIPLPSAQAHAELVTSSPAVGSHLSALPTSVSVTFDGNLLTIGGAKTNVLMVKDSSGKEIDAKNSRLSGATLSVDLNPVSTRGEFVVSWRVVSGDGHPEQSSYRFTVDSLSGAMSPTPSPTSLTSPTPAAAHADFWNRYRTRLLLLLGVLIAVGIWIRFEYARRKSE